MDRKNQIRVLAAKNEISIAKLAVEVGVRPHTLRRYTRHDAEPRLELCEKIAEFLGVSVAEVLGTEIDSQAVTTEDQTSFAVGISETELLNMPSDLLAELQAYLQKARSTD